MINPAVIPTFGDHFDGCSQSLGLEASIGNVVFDNFFPFHMGDRWGKHIVQSKHCKHHIDVVYGIPNIFVDDRPVSGTNYPALSCGEASISPVIDVELVPF